MLKIGENSKRYTLNKPFKAIGIYEQPNLIHLYNSSKDIQKIIKIIPQYEMNSYSKLFPELLKNNCKQIINSKINRCNWEKNDFLIHFAGMNYIISDKFKINIDIEIKKYVNIFYNKIIIKEGNDFNQIK